MLLKTRSHGTQRVNVVLKVVAICQSHVRRPLGRPIIERMFE
jgi:hypothetical protein